MDETIKIIVNLFILGILIYLIYIEYNTRSILGVIDEQDDYDNYMEKNGLNRYQLLNKSFDEMSKKSGIERKKEEDNFLTQEKNLNYQELDLCNNFINKNPKNLYAIFRRASLYSAIERYDEAINDYNYLMKKDPKQFIYVESCARLYANINNYDTALNLINYFYKNKKQDAQYFNAIGMIFYIKKDFQSAIKHYTNAIRLEPNNESSYWGRANVYRKMGEKDKYQSDINTHNELSKRHFPSKEK